MRIPTPRLALSALVSTSLTFSLLLTTSQAADQTGEGALSIVAWPGYIERGETDKTYDWVTEFEGATGCKVTVKTAGTSDEMVSLMNQGSYDLVTASGDASLRLIAGKKVQPIDITKVPGWKRLDERLQNAPWHTVNGVHYGVPFVWGPNVLMYNSTVFPATPPPGPWSSSRRTCRTARPTRAACRPMTGRSTWRTPQST